MKLLSILSLAILLGLCGPSVVPSAAQMGRHPGLGQWNHTRSFVQKLIMNDQFRKKLEAKMSAADAAALEVAVADLKAQMTALKPIHEQIRAARASHDTLQLRALRAEVLPHFKSMGADRKTIREILLPYRKAMQSSADATGGGDLSIAPLFPNPFHANTGNAATLQYTIQNPGNVHVVLFDGHGNLVRDLQNEQQLAGEHSASIPTGGLQPGVYVVQIQASGESKTTKLVIVQ